MNSSSILEGLSNSYIKGSLGWIKDRTFLDDPVEAKRLAQEVAYYTIIGGELYKRGLSQLILKCLTLARISYVLEEVQDGSCGYHLKRKALALKVLRAGHY